MVQPKYNPQEALERVKLMMNYDLSKTSVENKKVIEEQTQASSVFSCVKNYYTSKNAQYEEYSTDGYEAFDVTLSPKLVWSFSNSGSMGQQWLELKKGDNIKKKGTWNCIGGSNFTIMDESGKKIIYDTRQPVQTQPAQTQPVQTQPKADNKQDTPDPSKPQKLKPKDSPLGTTLKDTSIPKRSCVVFIDQFYSQYRECPEGINTDYEACKKEEEIIQQRKYVQRCMNKYFPSGSKQGNWGITGLGGSETDQKLLKLSACRMEFVGRPNQNIVNAPAPSQSGPNSIFRLTRKC